MKSNSFSTFELADLLLSQAVDWVLVRVHDSYAVFENPESEFLLTRGEIMEHLKRQGLILAESRAATTLNEPPILEVNWMGGVS